MNQFQQQQQRQQQYWREHQAHGWLEQRRRQVESGGHARTKGGRRFARFVLKAIVLAAIVVFVLYLLSKGGS